MRLFRRVREAKTSVLEREALPVTADTTVIAALVPPSRPSSPIAPVAEPSSVEERTPTVQSGTSTHVRASNATPTPAPTTYETLDDSDVFVCKHDEGPRVTGPSHNGTSSSPGATVAREVTLFVHAWLDVEPGLLSWTFPSLRAALDAVQRMKNAIGWCVVSGTGWQDLESARARGAILVEQIS